MQYIQQSKFTPLFFLFTCVKDGRKYIKTLFNSLLSQTDFNFVHYIYEDGSVDTIEDLVNEYKLKASYQVMYEKNSINIGLNMATKHCIDICNLPYFIWIDCDNWVDKNFFFELGKAVKKNKKGNLFRTRCYRDNLKNKSIDTAVFPLFSDSLKNKYCKWIYFFRGYKSYYYSFFAMKTEYFKEKMYFDFLVDRHLFNDDQVLSHYYLTNDTCVFVDKAKGFQLIREDSESASICSSQLDSNVKIYKEYTQNLFRESGVYKPDLFEHYYHVSTSCNKIFQHYTKFENKSGFSLLVSTCFYCLRNKVRIKWFISFKEFIVYFIKYIINYNGKQTNE